MIHVKKFVAIGAVTVLVGAFVLGSYLISNGRNFLGKEAKANGGPSFRWKWSSWSEWSNWSECQSKEIDSQCGGVIEGEQTRTRTRTCHLQISGGSNECEPFQEQTQTQDGDCEIELPPCIEDVCPNLDGIQEELPNGYHLEEGEEEKICVPNRTEQPESPHIDNWQLGGAPQCNDGTVLELPLNVQVLRSGADATVKWIPTAGNLVNVYYKELGQVGWTHAVGDEPNDGEVVIHLLKPELGYEFGLQQHQGCGGGQTVIVGVVDGPETREFNASYWVWSE